jgi:site-specific DNA recombinase
LFWKTSTLPEKALLSLTYFGEGIDVENHLSMKQIVSELHKSGIKTQHEFDEWYSSTIARILKNTAYVGYLYYNKSKRKEKRRVFRDKSEWIRTACPPIIPTEIFEAAGEKLKENKNQFRKRPKRFFLLSGIIFCTECHHAYTAQVNGTADGVPTKGYRHRINHRHCCDRWIRSERIEPLIWNAIAEILLDPKSLRRGYEKMMESEAKKEERNIKHLEALKNGIERLIAKRGRLQQVYLDPDIGMSKDEYLQEKRVIEDQIKTMQEDILQIEKELSHVPSEDDLTQLEETAVRIVEALGSNLDIPETEKRRILELLNVKVLISPDGQIKLTGFFQPEFSGLLSQPSRHSLVHDR